MQLGQILDERYKDTKTQLPLLKNLEQKQGIRKKQKQGTEHAPCSTAFIFSSASLHLHVWLSKQS